MKLNLVIQENERIFYLGILLLPLQIDTLCTLSTPLRLTKEKERKCHNTSTFEGEFSKFSTKMFHWTTQFLRPALKVLLGLTANLFIQN